MKKHLMVDLESLAVTPDAVILSLGAVHFDPWGTGILDEIYFRITIDDQDALGRTIDPNTLEWWSRQDPKIIDEAFDSDNRITFADSINVFHKFAWGCDKFWSHGAVFDLMILENSYAQLGKQLPWHYHQLRCSRTMFDLGVDPEMPQDLKHDALADAKRQAIGIQNVYRKLGIVQGY